jgi:putative tryptophan/tyrosine transport system substrate-binding protein
LIAYLTNPTNPVFADAERKELQVAARVLGVRLLVVKASDASEFEVAFATVVLERADALVVGGDVFFANHFDQLVSLVRCTVGVSSGSQPASRAAKKIGRPSPQGQT